MKSFLAILVIFGLCFSFTLPVLANDSATTAETETAVAEDSSLTETVVDVAPADAVLLANEEISAPDEDALTDQETETTGLAEKEVTKMPSRWSMFWQKTAEKVNLALTRDITKKAEKRLTYANKKVAQAEFILEHTADPKKQAQAEKLLSEASAGIQAINDKLVDIKAKSAEKAEEFSNRLAEKLKKQHDILAQLESKVPAEVLEKIKDQKDKQLEHLQQVFEKMDNFDPTAISARLEKIFDKNKDSELKPLKDLEFINELKAQLPAQAEAFQKIEDNRREAFKDRIADLPEKDREEKIKAYINTNLNEGNQEEILQDRADIIEKLGADNNLPPKIRYELTRIKNFTEARIDKADQLEKTKEDLAKAAEAGDENSQKRLEAINQRQDQLQERNDKIKNEIVPAIKKINDEIKAERQGAKESVKTERQQLNQEVQKIRQEVKEGTVTKEDAKKNVEQARETVKQAIEQEREKLKETVEQKREERKDLIEKKQEERKEVREEKREERKDIIEQKQEEKKEIIDQNRAERQQPAGQDKVERQSAPEPKPEPAPGTVYPQYNY